MRLSPFTFALPGLLFLVLSGCNNDAATIPSATDSTKSDTTVATSTPVRPIGLKPVWGQDLRQTHTPADAVMALVAQNNIPIPAPMVDTMGREPLPITVYYHGGGWVIADINTYDASAQGLAEQTNAIVVAVEYRKAPEHKFPVAVNDAFAAYKWVLKNADSLKGDGKKVAVAGESAGGNLAANVSILARDKGIQLPVYQVLVYPVASNNVNSASYMKSDSTHPLNKAMMQWFFSLYAPSMSELSDPRSDLVKANLKGLPPTTVITAEIDVPEAKDAQALASADLKGAFSKP